jgi:methylated-DNA-[protein]-cysteine S-methyltransferase
MYYTRFDTDLCEIILAGYENVITALHLNTGEGKRIFEIHPTWERGDSNFTEAIKQINEYINGERKVFSLEISPEGTVFQKRVWGQLLRIPYGEVWTYGELAAEIGDKRYARAVGMANSKNPIPLIIPCHRVIGSSGDLTGFAHGIRIKKQLLELETGNK